MSGGQIMAVIIVAIVMFATVIKSRHRGSFGPDEGELRVRSDETERLRDEVKKLKERLAVLERITVEKENTLDRDIERLRDR